MKKPSRLARALVIAFSFCVVAVLAGCSQASEPAQSSSQSSGQSSSSSQIPAAEPSYMRISDLRVASMKGATSVGLAYMMQTTDADFKVVATADEIGPLLLQDEVDVACVPANLAAALYQKTNGGIKVIDINTLGVLNVVTADESIDSVRALQNHTVYMTGKGTVPEYTVAAILKASGIPADSVDLQFKSEPAEVAALLNADSSAIGILPQPFATAATMKNPDLRIAVDLTDAWDDITYGEQGELITGVTIAKTSYIEDNPEIISAFLQEADMSAEVAQTDPAGIAQTVVDLGIIDNYELAVEAIPNCSVAYITGDKMRAALSGYLQMLYEQNPDSIGGAMPDNDFYYTAG